MILMVLAAFAADTSLESLHALKAGNPLTARRLAEETLKRDPDDYVAHTVVAQVYWEEDGNLPRGMYHYRKAAKLYNLQGEDSFSTEVQNWDCHRLKQQAWLHEEMEQPKQFYRLVDEYNRGCNPDMKAEIAWRLMKDERFDDARAIVEEGLRSDDPVQQLTAGNVQCALDAKLRDRERALESCIESAELTDRLGYVDTVDAYNAGWSALQAADHASALEWLQKASNNAAGNRTNPWVSLTALRLQRGEGPKALDALQRMQQWRHAQLPADRAQNRADADATLAEFLLATGRADDARTVINRAIARPDRRASTTSSAGMTETAHRMMRIRIRRVQREREAERRVSEWWWSRWPKVMRSWLPDPEDTDDRVRVAGLMQDAELFEQTFALLNDHGVPLTPWMIGDFIDVLGPGLVQASLDQERKAEALSTIHAYYDALETEIAWQRGRSDLPTFAERALTALPKTEVLLRARVQAHLADHQWRWKQRTSAAASYSEAFRKDPGVFRRLGWSLPTSFQSDGSPKADELLAMLRLSPRFHSAGEGFVLTARNDGICLSNPLGQQVHCTRDARLDAHELVDTFHLAAFSIPIGASNRIDMNSLDGTTNMRRQDQRDRVEQLMRGYP